MINCDTVFYSIKTDYLLDELTSIKLTHCTAQKMKFSIKVARVVNIKFKFFGLITL